MRERPRIAATCLRGLLIWLGLVGISSGQGPSALATKLKAGQSVHLPKGIFPVTGTLTLVADGQVLEGEGPETVLLCDPRANFSIAVAATSRDRVTVRNLTVDCNREARQGILTTRTVGIYLTRCRHSVIQGCTVRNTIGGPAQAGGKPMSGVGIAVSSGLRNAVLDCRLFDCGLRMPGKASDAVYTSGDFTVIQGCAATNCTDTGFVLENSNHGTISDCQTTRCSAGLAITNASGSTNRGNRARDVTIDDWSAAVTGGIQIGILTERGTGDLVETSLTNIQMVRRQGKGPAIHVRRVGPGKVSGLTLRGVTIQGAGTQGILLQAEHVLVASCRIQDTGAAAIEVEPGSTEISIRFNQIDNATNFGIVIKGPAPGLLLDGNTITGRGAMKWGIYQLIPKTAPYAVRASDTRITRTNIIRGWNAGEVGRGT
jgi:parallel beta-helix repeat protein